MGILLFVSGYLADWSQEKGYLTTTQGINFDVFCNSKLNLNILNSSTLFQLYCILGTDCFYDVGSLYS
jgi:hypothetical protein